MWFRSGGLALLAVLLATAPARAAVYNWSYSDPNRSGSGTLTVSGGGSPFAITGITGSFAGKTIFQLTTDGSCCGAPGPDNLFFSPGPFLSGNGVGFETLEPGFYTIAFFNGSYATLDDTGLFTENGSFTATLVPGSEEEVRIPEPASLGLLALGVAGLAVGAGRGRRRGPGGAADPADQSGTAG